MHRCFLELVYVNMSVHVVRQANLARGSNFYNGPMGKSGHMVRVKLTPPPFVDLPSASTQHEGVWPEKVVRLTSSTPVQTPVENGRGHI